MWFPSPNAPVDVEPRTFPGVTHDFIGMDANVPEVLRAKAAFAGAPRR